MENQPRPAQESPPTDNGGPQGPSSSPSSALSNIDITKSSHPVAASFHLLWKVLALLRFFPNFLQIPYHSFYSSLVLYYSIFYSSSIFLYSYIISFSIFFYFYISLVLPILSIFFYFLTPFIFL